MASENVGNKYITQREICTRERELSRRNGGDTDYPSPNELVSLLIATKKWICDCVGEIKSKKMVLRMEKIAENSGGNNLREEVVGNSGVRELITGALPLSRQEGRGSRAQKAEFVIIV